MKKTFYFIQELFNNMALAGKAMKLLDNQL